MIRIGVNALYLIPGGVGGTEIYLRNLLKALAEIDSENQYIVFSNRETDAGLVPDSTVLEVRMTGTPRMLNISLAPDGMVTSARM